MKMKSTVPSFAARSAIFVLAVIVVAVGAFPDRAFAQRMPQDSWYLAKEVPAETRAQFNYPRDVAVAPDGNLYVADRDNGRIQVLDSQGALLRTWDGTSSQVPNGFFNPQSIHVAADGKVYINDNSTNYRVLVFDAQGKFLRAMGNGYGSNAGQFTSYMRGLAVDSAGNVYVGDSGNYRVTVFDAEGNYVRQWGQYGDGDGSFYGVRDVQVLPDGNIAVLSDGLIQVFSPEGVFQTRLRTDQWNQYAFSADAEGNYYVFIQAGSIGKVQKRSASGDLLAEFDLTGVTGNYSEGITVAGDRIYIADYNNHRITLLGSAGNFIANWGVQGSTSSRRVFGLAVDGQGNVFLADSTLGEIRKYDPELNLLKSFGSSGTADGQFSGLRDVAVGSNNRLYALEQAGNRVQIFDLDGNFLGKFGSTGTADGRFQAPSGIAVGRDNKVYVADKDNHRVQIFDANGAYLGKFGKEGSFDGEFKSPSDVAVFPNGDIIVSDSGNSRVQVFGHDGGFLRKRSNTDLIGGLAGNYYYFSGQSSVFAGSDGLVYLASSSGMTSDSVLVADQQLNGLKNWSNSGGVFAETPRGDLITAGGDGLFRIWNRTSRTVQPSQPNALPLPRIVAQQRRPGTSLVDVDYTVKDADNATVQTAALAFKDGGNTLDDVIPMTSFAEGTGPKLGANIATGQTHRFTWNAGQDWNADFGQVQFEILAKDGRELLNLDYIQIPASGNTPALKISRSPLDDNDLLSAWYWLIATRDPGLTFSQGMVRKAGSAAITDGLTATYYSKGDFTGVISTASGQTPNITSTIEYDNRGREKVKTSVPTGTKSVRWTGFILVESPGRFSIDFYAGDSDANSTYGTTTVRVGFAVETSNDSSGSVSFTAGAVGLVPFSVEHVLATGRGPYISFSGIRNTSDWSSQRPFALKDFKTAPGLLANGVFTTDAGREHLFAKMGLREATAEEVLRAKEAGNPGAPINQWDPKLQVGPGERPAKINAYGFDTGGSGYWVVPVNQSN